MFKLRVIMVLIIAWVDLCKHSYKHRLKLQYVAGVGIQWIKTSTSSNHPFEEGPFPNLIIAYLEQLLLLA
jgi:hypothetical protein